MWIPRWVGEPYAILYEKFRSETFRFKDALKALSVSPEMAKAVLSRLHRESLLAIFDRGRPRLYRLMDPETFAALASGSVHKLSVPQERYLKLIYDCCRALRESVDLTSLAVYGSVARGGAGETSDLDLFVVSDSFKGTLGERIEHLMRTVERKVRPETEFLQANDIYTLLSFYTLREDEAEKLPLIMLDMVDDAKIVYDKGRFLEAQLLKLKLRLAELNAKKMRIGKGEWYWDLGPDQRLLKATPE